MQLNKEHKNYYHVALMVLFSFVFTFFSHIYWYYLMIISFSAIELLLEDVTPKSIVKTIFTAVSFGVLGTILYNLF